MVRAEIQIGTCYGDVVIPVEVLGKGPRPGTAWVRALNGLEPFTKTSHGGPYQDSKAVVLIPHLRDVRIESDPEQEVQIPTDDRLLPADWFLESAYEDRTYIE